MALEVTLDRTAGRTVVRPVGEIDLATVDRFAAAMREAAAQGPVLVDLSELAFMDSSGVRAIHAVLAGPGDVRFARSMRDNVRQVLALTGMLDALPFADA